MEKSTLKESAASQVASDSRDRALACQLAEEIAAEIEIRASIESAEHARFERGDVEPLRWAALEAVAVWH